MCYKGKFLGINILFRNLSMSLIITLLVYLVIFAICWWIVGQIPLPGPTWVVPVIFGVIFLIMVCSVVGIIPGAHFPLIHLG
jgi:O-antigen/teichoic acid export membrane protein